MRKPKTELRAMMGDYTVFRASPLTCWVTFSVYCMRIREIIDHYFLLGTTASPLSDVSIKRVHQVMLCSNPCAKARKGMLDHVG